MHFSGSAKGRFLLWSLIVVLLFFLGGRLKELKEAGSLPLNDFVEYWAASRIFLAGGDPYDSAAVLELQRGMGWTDQRPVMMWNPPWTIPLLLPFCMLPFSFARGAWFLLHVLLVLSIARWAWRVYSGPLSVWWVSILAAVFFLPIGTALFLGQISPLVLAGVAAFIIGLRMNGDYWAGAATLAIGVKPHLLYLFWIFLLFWIWRERRWKVLAGAAAAFTVASGVVLALNPSIFQQYFNGLNSPIGPGIWQTPTWGVALIMLLPRAGAWIRFLPSLLGIVVAGLLWRSWRTDFDWLRHMPTICLLSITTATFTWMFDWVVLLPIVIIILCRTLAYPSRFWWLATALLATQPLLAFSPQIANTNFYTIWLPPVLWVLYWLSGRSQRAYAASVLPAL